MMDELGQHQQRDFSPSFLSFSLSVSKRNRPRRVCHVNAFSLNGENMAIVHVYRWTYTYIHQPIFVDRRGEYEEK